jgi:hypothetical protein
MNALTIDQSPIPYVLIEKKGIAPRQTELTYLFQDRLKSEIKIQTPKFYFWEGWSPIKVLVADYDQLPQGYSNWDQFREHLNYQYFGKGLVTSSYRKKAKILFKTRTASKITFKSACATLQSLLEVADYGVDATVQGISTSFVTREMYDALDGGRALDLLPVYDAVEPQQTAINSFMEQSSLASTTWKFHKFDQESVKKLTPVLARDHVTPKVEAARWSVIRYIISSAALAITQIELPQTKLTRECSFISGVEFALVDINKAIQSLKRLEILELTKDTYMVGSSSKGYQARGVLKEICEEILKNRHEVPTSIEPGRWHSTLVAEVFYFVRKGREEWDRWFYSLPDCRVGDRVYQMENVWKWAVSRFNENV